MNAAYIYSVNVSPLQEERTLCSLSGGAVTPDSQLDESASPADTTEDDSLPMRPWGRSQSLPAYADLIMVIIWLTVLPNHFIRLSIPSRDGFFHVLPLIQKLCTFTAGIMTLTLNRERID